MKSSPPSLPEIGEVIEGKYEILSPLGRGARGFVFRARQLQISRDVAIKFIHPHVATNDTYIKRFLREIDIATRFNHPSIVRVYDVGETTAGLPFIVMEILEGRDLKDTLEVTGPMNSLRAVRLLEELLDGLAEAHTLDIVHRDIKPANLFLASNQRGQDRLKILDFGIARLIDPNLTRLTSSGTFTGTPAYMPPECFLLEDFPGHKAADIYAAGLVLLEVLTGVRPLKKASLDQLVIFHIGAPILIPRRVADSPLGPLIRKATMKHPEDRFAHADAMLKALRAAKKDIPEFTLTPDEVPPAAPLEASSIFQYLGDVESNDEKLALLRNQPQHTTYPEGQPLPTRASNPTPPAPPPPAPAAERRRFSNETAAVLVLAILLISLLLTVIVGLLVFFVI